METERIRTAVRSIQAIRDSNYDAKVLRKTLIRSCGEGNLELVTWLVEHTAADVNYKATVRAKTAWNEEMDVYITPLTAACWYGHVHIVKYLAEKSNVDVNLPESNEWGYTPLIKACLNARMSVSTYLLQEVQNLDINVVDKKGYTALHYAISCGRDNGRTALHKACIKGDTDEVVKLLKLADTADYMEYIKEHIISAQDHIINSQDNYSYTPLHYACFFGHSNIAKTLMVEGADETITNDLQKTPAQVAEWKGRSDMLKLLSRVSLMEVLHTNKLMNRLLTYFLIILTLNVIRQKIDRTKWYQLSRACFR